MQLGYSRWFDDEPLLRICSERLSTVRYESLAWVHSSECLNTSFIEDKARILITVIITFMSSSLFTDCLRRWPNICV